MPSSSNLPDGFQIKNLDLKYPPAEQQREGVLAIKNLDLLDSTGNDGCPSDLNATEKVGQRALHNSDGTEKTQGSSHTSSSSSCSTTSEQEDHFEDKMDDDGDKYEEEDDDAFHDDDSCSSLDGMIPSMASQSLFDNSGSHRGPTIHYMGRDHAVDELSENLSQSSQRYIQDSSCFSHRGSRRRRSSRQQANSMSISCQEHLSDRWASAKLEENDPKQSSSANNDERQRNQESRQRNRTKLQVDKTDDSMDNSMVASLRRASVATISSWSRRVSTSSSTSSSSHQRMSSESESIGSTRRSRTTVASSSLQLSSTTSKPRMDSQSEHFGSKRRVSTTDVPRTRHHAATYRRAHTSAPTGYLSSLVGKVSTTLGRETAAEAAAAAKSRRWNDQLDRWGYSNHDVLCVVQDDHVFKKLQRDLRDHKAVTNGTIQQKIHVFVHNTRSKQLQHQLKQERRRTQRHARKQLSSSQHSNSERRQARSSTDNQCQSPRRKQEKLQPDS